jgi:hypothetical protein
LASRKAMVSRANIEGISILEVVVPDLVDYLTEDFGGAALCCLVAGVVVKAGAMG